MTDAAIFFGALGAGYALVAWDAKRHRNRTARRVFTGRNRP